MSQPSVLLVDDDPALLAGMRRGFRHEPFALHVAPDARGGRAVLRNSPVDVLICDHELPGLPGVEFLVEVRRDYPEVISMLLTGRGDIEVAADALNRGEVFRVFTKPCDTRQLALAIGAALQQRDVIRRAREALQAADGQSAHAGVRAGAGGEWVPVYEVPDEGVDLAALLREIDRPAGPERPS